MSYDQDPKLAASASVVSEVRTIFDYPTYQALRRAKRSLNRFDAFLWNWRYALFPGMTFISIVFYSLAHGRSMNDFLSWDFLSIISLMILALVVFIGITDLAFEGLTRWIFGRFAMANKSIVITFTENGIAWSSEGLRGEISWTKVIRLITSKGYLFFFISKQEAIGLSRRAVATEEEFESIVSYAKERVNA